MGSMYLAGADLAAYGVPDATAPLIQQASDVVDGFLQRPEGLIWSPDANGAPAYMAALAPMQALTSTGSISPGSNVVVPVTGGFINTDTLGEVYILDRADPTKTEACVVSAVGAGSITLQSVARAHNAGSLLEAGLVLLEERSLPSKRSVTRVSRSPLVRLLSGMGRYAYGRRSDQTAGFYNDMNLLAIATTFGGPPMWVTFDITQASVSNASGEVWVPAGMMLAAYSEVRLRYVAGWAAAGLPSAVKQATANLVTALMTFPEITGNTKRISAGGTTIERFKDTLLDTETRSLLAPFEAKLFF